MIGHCLNSYSRNTNGIILLDKPVGLSSNYVLQKVKRLFRAKKAGHTGALDLLATGMLPICLGEATKFAQYLLNADKRYHVTARLGERTNTSDSEGKIIKIRPVSLNKDCLDKALNYFIGKVKQVPSMFSALKYHGCPLYKYARKDIIIERKERTIQIYDLKLHDWNLTEIKLEIHCSKGTYIRTIIDDLGERLGCGAHVTALRRVNVADYPTDRMVTFAEIQTIYDNNVQNITETLTRLDALLLPIESALIDIPIVNLSSHYAKLISLGQTVKLTMKSKASVLHFTKNLVRLTEKDTGYFLGIGEIIAPGILKPYRLISRKLIN